ncbi:MAG: hypothetical protein IAE79_02640, partial [Anaerolinea sp.]|nr:hypothetical protein [Anaerolinea sp.]
MQSLARKIVDLLGITSKGQATMANSLPIAIASNQSAVPVSGGLTNAELRASAVPVSGGLTNAE